MGGLKTVGKGLGANLAASARNYGIDKHYKNLKKDHIEKQNIAMENVKGEDNNNNTGIVANKL